VRFDDDLREIEFTIENRDPQPGHAHSASLSISGLPGTYEITAGGRALSSRVTGPETAEASVPIVGERVQVQLRRLTER
jgi:hypothetical protein